MILWIGLALAPLAVWAEPVRLAVYHTDLERTGPGLLLRDIQRGESEDIPAVARIIEAADPDILLILGFDYDAGLVALAAFSDLLAEPFPHLFALRPNAGWQTGVDVDGDGRLAEPQDAHGYGRFSGAGGMAILSRHPIATDRVIDLSHTLWRDLPAGRGAEVLSPAVLEVLRLPTMGLWQVPVQLPGGDLTLLVTHAGPPVFDGPEDRNGLRNEDETRLLLAQLPGQSGPFAVMGTLNVDPEPGRGEGRRGALLDLLAHPRLQDPVPLAPDGTAATTNWSEPTPGRLRVDYILPSTEIGVLASGIVGTADDPEASAASGHRLVWVDIALPE